MKRWTLCFDLDDTLMATAYRYRRASKSCADIIRRAMGDRCVHDVKRILTLHESIDICLVEAKGYAVDRFPTSWVLTYRLLCRIAGMRPQPKVCRRLFAVASQFRRGPFRPFPGVKSMLRRFRSAGHSLHLITAGDEKLQWRKITQSGLHAFFHSVHVTGTDKKKAMARIIAGRPKGALMVGDSKRTDIRPANDLGMLSVLVTSSETWSYTHYDVTPDRVIASVHELERLLQSMERKRKKKK